MSMDADFIVLPRWRVEAVRMSVAVDRAEFYDTLSGITTSLQMDRPAAMWLATQIGSYIVVTMKAAPEPMIP